MFYRSTEHKAKVVATLKDLHKPIYQMNPEFLSALFLLSSNNKLWNRTKYSYAMNHIDIERINMRGLDSDNYTLCKIAQDL